VFPLCFIPYPPPTPPLPPFPTRRSSDLDRPRAVRAVALDLRTPVDHEQRAARDLDVARLGVGERAVWTAGDDRGEAWRGRAAMRSEEHTSELQSPCNLVCRLLLEKKKKS